MKVKEDSYSIEGERESHLPFTGTPSTVLLTPELAGRFGGEAFGHVLLLALREHREELLSALAAVPLKPNTRYQAAGTARTRLTFRPEPSTWHELRRFAHTFNVSICFVVSVLLTLAFNGVGTPSRLTIPPRLERCMELWATERFGVYTGRIEQKFSFRLPPEIRAMSAFQFWARDV